MITSFKAHQIMISNITKVLFFLNVFIGYYQSVLEECSVQEVVLMNR